MPEGIEADAKLPVIFVADGYWYIKALFMPEVMDRLIDKGSIEPVVAVFVDARDPDNLNVNRRNQEFYCSVDYLQFYTDELIPTLEQQYPLQSAREARAILGLSFGGLNAACFGLLGWETFANIGMHSPATHPIRTLLPAYEQGPKLPLKIFLSTGWPDDNTGQNRKFRRILKDRGYDLKFVQTPRRSRLEELAAADRRRAGIFLLHRFAIAFARLKSGNDTSMCHESAVDSIPTSPPGNADDNSSAARSYTSRSPCWR